MSANLMGYLMTIVNLKQINKEELEEVIKEGLFKAINKKLKPENELEIDADFSVNKVYAKFYKFVVENDYSLGEISLNDARKIKPNAQIGDKILTIVPIYELGPKIIKNAKHSILKRLKELEEKRTISNYETRKHQVVSGRIRKVDVGVYYVDIGFTDAILSSEEQVEDEYFKVDDVIKAYVLNIRKRKNDMVVILSRKRAEFVKKLFELEVPEISSGIVEIVKIVREPGIRTKVAVKSNDPKVDPVASCIGEKGIRIESIKKELNGEIIDIIKWEELPDRFIVNSIGEDFVEKVYLAQRGKFARVIVNEKNKNYAIGKNGKNVKLAAKLTGYKIDIFTEEEFEEKISEERRITSHVTDLDGVTAKVAEILKSHGYTSVQDIYEATEKELSRLEGLDKKTIERIKEAAKYF